ncbi:DUF4397 domain-containing protein [Aestuariibacter halophilus]|uniref:DUF4397 domain-containing protein n=1 Tax=Fluctibacter halophilus TaxID=226011 RepID=A0ABS8G5A1_9ALTE|nr:DUF4397 domain-containing protein [Aestuariibacter halophilus]MCC2615767.1 DUF4397 domain-containing protein [Aestuariibacter halophilus]
MRRIITLTAIVSLSWTLSGCFNDDDATLPEPTPPPAPTPTAELRVTHAAPDAPAVNIYANDAVLAGLENVDYQVSSELLSVDAGTYDVRVEAIVPGGNLDVIAAELTLEADTRYDVLAIDTVAEGVEPLVVPSSVAAVPAGNARVQIVHAAPNAPTVDIYVTAPDALLADEQPVATAAFRDFTAALEVPAGDYRVRITPAGAMTVVYDSGTLELTDGLDVMAAAVQNIQAGESPVALLLAGPSGAAIVADANTPAEVRVVHGISDAPAVDVIANNAVTLVDGLAFPMKTDYLAVEPADYLLDVVADADNSVIAIDDAPVTLQKGGIYTAIANSSLASADLDLLIDMPRSVATEAKVRIVHASPSAGAVDIYVTADGAIDNVDPAFSNVPYNTADLAETGYVSLAPGDYVVTVTPTGTKTAALETSTLMLEGGEIYTAIAVDGTEPGIPVQLIGLDGLAN